MFKYQRSRKSSTTYYVWNELKSTMGKIKQKFGLYKTLKLKPILVLVFVCSYSGRENMDRGPLCRKLPKLRSWTKSQLSFKSTGTAPPPTGRPLNILGNLTAVDSIDILLPIFYIDTSKSKVTNKYYTVGV